MMIRLKSLFGIVGIKKLMTMMRLVRLEISSQASGSLGHGILVRVYCLVRYCRRSEY
jgi:hypothetical protein